MIFSKSKKTEDIIVELLLHSKKTVKILRAELGKLGHDYTLQAIYVILKDLMDGEVLIKHGFFYSVNEEWKSKINEKTNQQTTHILDGEKTIFLLNSLIQYDIQWKNIILPLHTTYPDDPIFFYNYHYIWIHLGESRENSELDYYRSFLKQKRYAFSLVGSHSPLEIETKKLIENNYVRIFIDDSPIKSTGYITIINDYIITSYLSKKIIQDVENCYKKAKTITELRTYIQKIDLETKRIKLVIERNKEKAKKLRKKLAKDFYIPKELREKFELF
jgi:hypothetical protein